MSTIWLLGQIILSTIVIGAGVAMAYYAVLWAAQS